MTAFAIVRYNRGTKDFGQTATSSLVVDPIQCFPDFAFDLTLRFNSAWKNRDHGCNFPPKIPPGSLILDLNRLNALPPNPTPPPEISQNEPSCPQHKCLGRISAVLRSSRHDRRHSALADHQTILRTVLSRVGAPRLR